MRGREDAGIGDRGCEDMGERGDGVTDCGIAGVAPTAFSLLPPLPVSPYPRIPASPHPRNGPWIGPQWSLVFLPNLSAEDGAIPCRC